MADVLKISAPVGQKPRPSKGKEPKNAKADVELVQQLLTGAGVKAPNNGKADAKTVEAIKTFQTKKVKLKDADGVVDPGGKTWKKLVDLGAANAVCEEPEQKTKRVSISYNVPAYKQPTNMSCWATAIAMMVAWKKKMSIQPETIADELGYTKQFKSGGLHPEDTKVFKHWGMKWEPPMCYTLEGFADLLKAVGPLWIAGNPKAPHVRVVVAMKGDGTPDGTKLTINDPAGGRTYSEKFTKTMGKMEDLGASPKEMKMKSPIYVAHM